MFVANRVTTILEEMEPGQWSHVISEENAADCASRGVIPSQFWVAWPAVVKNGGCTLAIKNSYNNNRRRKQNSSTVIKVYDLIDRFSSLSKMRRVTAIILRFTYNVKQNHVNVAHFNHGVKGSRDEVDRSDTDALYSS